MSLAIVYSRALAGIQAPLVTVEVHLSNGLPSMSIVGLPETAVKESKDRVRGALLNSQFEFPAKRITVNLAPADLPKEGGRFDLPIALGILAASGQIPTEALANYEFLGELALTGQLRRIQGALPVSWQTCKAHRTLVLPEENSAEAGLVLNATILGTDHLLTLCEHLHGKTAIIPWSNQDSPPDIPTGYPDLVDVRGQTHAKRALEIAAAGGHSLLMSGPPGTGKSMLASRLPGILPPLEEQESLETAAIASISSHGFHPEKWRSRPFRLPHHTASAAALVGGGSNPRPGEVSLAHNGVLFLDELPEFERRVLEVLREPMETGRITISRATRQVDYPARFQLLAAMNPCPCGYLGDSNSRCHCSPEQIKRYRARISGPLLDRIDMHIEVPRVPYRDLWEDQNPSAESSAEVRKRVILARNRQLQRDGVPNHQLQGKRLDSACKLNLPNRQLLEQATEKLGLSARAFHRILRVARTIADLDAQPTITAKHLSEAISYRRLDRAR